MVRWIVGLRLVKLYHYWLIPNWVHWEGIYISLSRTQHWFPDSPAADLGVLRGLRGRPENKEERPRLGGLVPLHLVLHFLCRCCSGCAPGPTIRNLTAGPGESPLLQPPKRYSPHLPSLFSLLQGPSSSDTPIPFCSILFPLQACGIWWRTHLFTGSWDGFKESCLWGRFTFF